MCTYTYMRPENKIELITQTLHIYKFHSTIACNMSSRIDRLVRAFPHEAILLPYIASDKCSQYYFTQNVCVF